MTRLHRNKILPAEAQQSRSLSSAPLRGIFFLFVLFAFHHDQAAADSIRPAYLEVVERTPGIVDVVWKVPKVPGLPESLWPALPQSYKASTPREIIDSPDAVLYIWSMAGQPLSGSTLSVTGLDSFTMDTLLRIELADGSVHRTVLQPTNPAFTLPAPTEETGQAGWPVKRWLYPTLLGSAFLLSLTPRARRQGIISCALALLIGSVSGHVLGSTLPRNPASMTDDEAKRILHGLMLNTYRAFVLQEDEAVYDALARSVDGEILGELYLQHRGVFSFDDPEAASSLVDRLDVKDIESMVRNPDGSLTLLTAWDAYGSVFHWEHVHFRCNAFRAKITIIPSEKYWKITDLEILEEERVL